MREPLGWVFAVAVWVAVVLGVPAVAIMVRDIVGWEKPSTRSGATGCKCGQTTREARP